jgi:site-specific recombinase XerD
MRRDPHTDTANLFSIARDYLHAYLPRTRGLSANTVAAYRISLECFLDYLARVEHIDRAQVGFDHFDRAHLKSWLAWMREEQRYAPATITLRLSAIKTFLAYSAGEDITLIALSQAAKTLHAPAKPRTPIEYLTEEQTRAVLAAHTGATAKSRRNRMLLILLYDTAARVSEITRLTLADLRLTHPAHVRLTGKRTKTRTVPLTGKATEHLRVYLEEFHPHSAALPATRPLFYSLYHGKPTALSVDTVAAVLKQAAHLAAAECPTVPQHIHCHMLRKTKAMDLYQQGIPLPIIMRLLGHENTSTTAAFYAFATLDMMRQAIDAANPAITSPTDVQLTEHALHTLYDLR